MECDMNIKEMEPVLLLSWAMDLKYICEIRADMRSCQVLI